MSQQSVVYKALSDAAQPLTLSQIAYVVGLDAPRLSSAVCKLRTYGYIELASDVRMGHRNIRTYRPTDKPYTQQPMGRP